MTPRFLQRRHAGGQLRMTGLVAPMAAATSMKKMYAQLTPEQISIPCSSR